MPSNSRHLVTTVLLLSTAVAAQAAERLEEVVVTAQKHTEMVNEVPIAITALSEAMLKSTGVSSPSELSQVTPSLVGVNGSGYFVPYIRGIGARAITPGNESAVASYVDGVYMTDKAGLLLFGFNDVESIAVLRGPQGTLFGRNATAGAITISTRGPTQEVGGNIEFTYGSEEQSGNLFVSGGLTDTLSASVSAFFKNEDGYIDNLNPGNGEGSYTGDSKASGIRAKLLWEPSDEFSALLSYDYIDNWDSAYEAVQAIPGTGLTTGEAVAAGFGIPIPDIRSKKRVYAGELPPKSWHRGQGTALTLNWSFDYFDLKSISSYRQEVGGVDLDLDGTPLSLFYFNTALSARTLQQEFTATSNLDGPLSWTAGLYYVDYHDGYNALDKYVGLSYPFNPAELGASTIADSKLRILDRMFVDVRSAAVYGDVGYEFTDATSVKLGLRYTGEKHTMDDHNKSTTIVGDGAGNLSVFNVTTTLATCNADPTCHGMSTSFEELTYRAVLNHKFNVDTLTYASYNRGFKSGVYNISTITNTAATEPEIVDAFELGLKTSLLDQSLELNLAVYYNDYQNMQVAVTSPSNTQYAINAAKSETSGLEAEARWQATSQLYIQGGFSTFFKAEYKSFKNCDVYADNGAGNTPVFGADCSGERLPSTPDYTVYISGDYTIPLSNGSEFAIGGLLSYQDDMNIASVSDDPAVTNPPVLKGYETLNLHATWSAPGDEYFVKLWGNNLTNADSNLGMFTTTFGFATTYARGATYGVTVGASF